MQQLSNLIGLIDEILKRYENKNNESGANFNIFQILKLERNEVRTHSAFLMALFDCRNNLHGCYNSFLNVFIQQQKELFKETDFIKRLEKFEVNTQYKIHAEYFIGNINENGTEGGRVDIVITDSNNNSIIIENKIDAGDQSKQLLRYNSWNNDAPIFYLTLNGQKPTPESSGNLFENDNFVCISYKYHILDWLDECVKIPKNINTQISILQYKNLIQNLTDMSSVNLMNKEIVDLFSKKENIIYAKMINENWNSIKGSIVKQLFSHDKLTNNLGCHFDINTSVATFNLNDYDNYRIKTFWADKELNTLHLRIERFTEFRDFDLEDSIRDKLASGKFSKTFIPKDEKSKNDFVWAILVEEWNETPWESILDEIPDTIYNIINNINLILRNKENAAFN